MHGLDWVRFKVCPLSTAGKEVSNEDSLTLLMQM